MHRPETSASAMAGIHLPLDARDVEECFLLFLGKNTDAAAARRCLDADLRGVVRELLSSDEFRVGVLRPLLLRATAPLSVATAQLRGN